MAGLLSAGTGLAGFMQGLQQYQQQAQQRQAQQLLMTRQQQQMQDEQQQNQALAGLIPSLLALPQQNYQPPQAGGGAPMPSPGMFSPNQTPALSRPAPQMSGTPGMTQPGIPPRQSYGMLGEGTIDNPAMSQGAQVGPSPDQLASNSQTDTRYTGGGGTEDYIRQGATARGLDPDYIVRGVNTEGGTGAFKAGDSGTSGGPFQLHVAGTAPGTTVRGLGDDFKRDTGLNPLDPANENATIDYSLDYIAAHGGRMDPSIWHGVRSLGPGGQKVAQAGEQVQQQIGQTATRAANAVPTGMWGGASIQQLAQAVEKANPNASPAVKGATLMMMQKMMAPDQQQMFQVWMQDRREAFQEALRLETERLLRSRQAEGQENKGYTMVTPEGGQPFFAKPGAPSLPVTGPGGQPSGPVARVGTKAAGGSGGPLSEAAADRYAKIFQSSGYLPPGIARSSAAIAQIMNKTGDMGTPGEFVANMATRQADTKSLANMTKIADAATAYENVAIRNFDQAMKYGEQLKSTDMGPWLNKWVLEGEKAIGDPTAPAYVTALITAANEYAKVMGGSTGSQGSTVDARREAAELFSPYLSQGQINEVVKVARAEMENRRQEAYAAVDDIKGRLREPTAGPMSRGHEPGASSGTTPQAGLPTDLPDPAGQPEGAVAKDENGKPVAKIVRGQWALP
jgi:type II secretory pathway pseudopilin PulG